MFFADFGPSEIFLSEEAVVTLGGGLASYPLIHVVAQSSEELIWKRRISVAFWNGLR